MRGLAHVLVDLESGSTSYQCPWPDNDQGESKSNYTSINAYARYFVCRHIRKQFDWSVDETDE